MAYILAIDQSTQGTKAIIVDKEGKILARADRAHEQIINEKGWVSHDLEEIYQNVLLAARDAITKAGVRPEEVKALGISNQRETSAIWHKSGAPLNHAIVWQCARAKDIAEALHEQEELIADGTGLKLSPYFPAAKLTWLLENTEGLSEIDKSCIRMGTIDTYLVYRLTNGESYKTDYSNASRTQLFNIRTLTWDEEICRLFRIDPTMLADVCDSNSVFGMTDMNGLFPAAIPICGVMGDSHAALFGQGCHEPGTIKTTYGTGSSIMMNIGSDFKRSSHGLVTSIAWGIDGCVDYVFEGNINYTGAVISWLIKDVGLVSSPSEVETLALQANPDDRTVIVPAFSGLGAPYWSNSARGLIYGMTRTTGKKELARAALDSIAYQISAVIDAMRKDSGMNIDELRVDGGPTRNKYLMQLQSNLSDLKVIVPDAEELSALGAGYMAGIKTGLFVKEELFRNRKATDYSPNISDEDRETKKTRWEEAVSHAIGEQAD